MPVAWPSSTNAGALVQREEVSRPVTELFGDVTGVVRECLGGVADFPPAAILERLRQVPVIKRRERRDAVGEKVIEEPVVESRPLGFSAPVPCGNIRGQEIENRYAVVPSAFIDDTSSRYRW